MKVPKIRQLPSGAYTCQLRIDGKSISITGDDPDKVYAEAVGVKSGLIKVKRNPGNMTLGQAIDKYIETKDAVLSPSTISAYKKMRKFCFQEIMDVQLSAINQQKLQAAVNRMAKEKSPKYVSNAYGLVIATLKEFMPDETFRIKLPQKKKYDYAVPTDEDIKAIIEFSKGTPNEIPILLAIWCGLRMSEIRAIKKADIKDGLLHIHSAIVDVDGVPTEKGTKSYSGTRNIQLPKYLEDLMLAVEGDVIVPDTANAIRNRFFRACEKNGLQHYRFHDLRHAHASVMLALGVPNKYAQERMGHATDNMLKNVYQHTMAKQQNEYTKRINAYFESLIK